MAESAALLVDEVLPHQPIRQWVLSVPIPLRFLLASRPAIMGQVLGIVYRTLATHLIHLFFEPLDFITKLAALVPKPRVNLTRFHGVFAPR